MGNWNNESGYAFGASPLTNNSGQASGATFSLNGATSVWCTGSANQLLNGYVNVSGGSMAFTVSGIPYARYSIYAYVGDFNFGTKEEATVNGAPITSPPRAAHRPRTRQSPARTRRVISWATTSRSTD